MELQAQKGESERLQKTKLQGVCCDIVVPSNVRAGIPRKSHQRGCRNKNETMTTTTDELTWSREGSRDSTLDRKQEMLRAGKTVFPREEHTN